MVKKLLVYMIEGTEYGPRTAEIGNWVGKAVYCNRASIEKILNRHEVRNPGIYCLKSSPKHGSFNERIYIGEAENIGVRLKQQLADGTKDFDELIFFVSKDDLLTKAHVKFLEARIIELALNAKSAEIVNSNKPSLPLLHEAEVSDMEFFLDQMKLILPIMGFKFLVSSTATVGGLEKVAVNKLYYIKSKEIKATMYQNEQGFVVTKGSQAKKKMASAVNETYKLLQQKLIETDLLITNGAYYEFAEDTIFSSPSSAANIVLGRQTPGPISWLDADNKTLKENIEKRSYPQ